MSNTPIQITTELSKALEAINTKLDKIDERLNKLEIGQARLEEKLDGLSKRVDSVDYINRGVFVAIIIAVLGGFAKIFGFIGSP
jgi:chromosome segregation ATPase